MLFAAQYSRYDRRRPTPREMLLLLVLLKINAAETYSVENALVMEIMRYGDELDVRGHQLSWLQGARTGSSQLHGARHEQRLRLRARAHQTPVHKQLVEADAGHAGVPGGRAYAALIFERLLLAPLVVACSPRMTPSASWICARMPAASIRC